MGEKTFLSRKLVSLVGVNSVGSETQVIARITLEVETTRKVIREKLNQLEARDDLVDVSKAREDAAKLSASLQELTREAESRIELLQEKATLICEPLKQLSEGFESIEEYREAADKVEQVKKIHKTFEGLNEALNRRKYHLAVERLTEARELQQQLALSLSQDVAFVLRAELGRLANAFANDLTLKREAIVAECSLLWKRCVLMRNDVAPDEELVNSLALELTDRTTTSEFESSVYALHQLNQLRPLVSQLSNFIVSHFVEPILRLEVNQIESKEQLLTAAISKHRPESLCDKDAERLVDVFSKLKLVFAFVAQSFGSLELIVTNLQECSHQAMAMSVERVLKPSIPGKRSDQSQYLDLIEKARQFNTFLVSNGLLSEENSPLSRFSDNILSHFASKMCQNFLIKAKTMVNEDIHSTLEVGSECVEGQDLSDSPMDCFDQSIYGFPACKVSVSTVEIINLIKDIIEEAKDCPFDCAVALLTTARNVVELYIDIVPVKYKKLINELPQQSALFHNSCMFLGHRMQTLAFEHRETLASANVSLTFLDLVPVLRQLAADVFLRQMNQQKTVLLDFLQDTAVLQCLNENANLNELDLEPFESATKKCLLHLEFLKRCWVQVIPRTVYNLVMGLLLNTFMEEIVTRVLALEDISANAGKHLSQVMDNVSNSTLRLFFRPNVPLHVLTPKCFPFQELQFILEANLRETVDRWADGKGPLAEAFRADQVKHLIRALFQNSDKRALALSKIK